MTQEIFFDKFNIALDNSEKRKDVKIDLSEATFIYPKVLFFFDLLERNFERKRSFFKD